MDELSAWLVAMLALYGAILSTYNVLSTQRRNKMAERRTLRVRAAHGIPIYNDGVDRGDMVIVSVTNIGQRSVRVNSIELELPDGSHYPKIARDTYDTQLPATLKDGEEAAIHYHLPALEAALYKHLRSTDAVSLTPMCKDSVGNRYTGDLFEVQPKMRSGNMNSGQSSTPGRLARHSI